jgi:2-polyprenyl-6-methoxyphenol hydroxylase-like FAD-dependent oxidoreductase
MAEILVLGAGLTGLTTAMLLSRDGHDVTVLERDPDPPPPDAETGWTGWERGGVAQFRQLHLMLPRWREVMETELPAVLDALRAAGGRDHNVLHQRPVSHTGGWQAGDERFGTVTGRRPVVEAAVAAAAATCTGLRVRRGAPVTGLLTSGSGPVPRVVGVRTADGDLRADLVVDAGGRRSAVGRWIVDSGGRAPIEARADCGFVYYGRHYRGPLPAGVDSVLSHNDSVSLLTLPGDNGTWGVGITTSSRDHDLRALRHISCWEAAMRCYPATAGWIEAEPITGVSVMAGIEDRRRDLVVDSVPVVTGLVAVGDAWASTNPSLGRGASIGALHACVLRDVVAKEGTDDPEALVLRFDAETSATVSPYVESTLAFDRHRLAEIEADVAGVPYAPADPIWAMTRALWAGGRQDPVLARTLTTIGSVQATPQQLLADPLLRERVARYLGQPHYAAGASRAELLAAVHGAERVETPIPA